jgi:urease accessory protein
MRSLRRLIAPAAVLMGAWLLANTAWAHPGHEHDLLGNHSFLNGWLHPLAGLDHLLAMVAVGLLAVRVGGRAVWLLPATFLASMCAGGLMAGLGLPVSWVEHGIAASVLVFGLLLAAWGQTPLRLGVPLVASFAVFHGWAHVAEMSSATAAAPYVAGFVLATALLHLAGLAAGLALRRGSLERSQRRLGWAIAAASLLAFAGWL